MVRDLTHSTLKASVVEDKLDAALSLIKSLYSVSQYDYENVRASQY